MPYFVPAWAFRTIGTSTIRLPRKTVRTACHQFMPPPISDEASMYVGMHAAREIHSAAKLAVPHFRPAAGTGARSSLYSRLCRTSVVLTVPPADLAGILM